MRTFHVDLLSPWGCETLDDAVGFVGRDTSGSFGVLPDAERRLTVLAFGLAQVQRSDGTSLYLALPGGVFTFRDNHLTVATTNYVRSGDLREILDALESSLLQREVRVREVRESVRHLEASLLKRLAEVSEGLP